MTHEEFQVQLAAMSLFPEAVTAYALDVSKDIQDSARTDLMNELQTIYGRLEPIEEERMKRVEELMAKVHDFRKQRLGALKSKAEKKERDEELSDIDTKISSL